MGIETCIRDIMKEVRRNQMTNDNKLNDLSRDEYYLEWKSQGFKPDAVDFLRTKM